MRVRTVCLLVLALVAAVMAPAAAQTGPPDRLGLSVDDGDAVRGSVRVVGTSTAADDDLTLTVDGGTVETTDAGPAIVFEGDGIQTVSQRFSNRFRIGTTDIPMPAYDIQGYQTVRIPVDPALVPPGAATVTVVAGDAGGANKDDFTVRDVRLELLDGTTLRDPAVDPEANLFLGDGCCPDPNRAHVLTRDFAYTVPAGTAATGVVHEWDTTTVPDGTYQVAVRAGTDERAVTVTVDNTAPEIEVTSPADGARYDAEIPLRATAEDAGSGPAALTARLDGDPVEIGTTLPAGALDAGPHALEVTARDAAGNTATRTVRFEVGAVTGQRELVLDTGGELLAGTATVYGRSSDPRDELTLSVDGTALRAGPAGAVVVFEASGLQGGPPNDFDNAIVVGGTRILLPAENVDGFGEVRVPVPADLLAAGRNTITIAAGTKGTDNADDFSVRDVRLLLPDGTELRDPSVDPAASLFLGDGCCPDPTRVPILTRDFAVALSPSQAGAVSAEWDTTAVADGVHEVRLAATGPQGIGSEARAVTVDNTPPEITVTSPEQDERYKGELPIAAAATDALAGLETLTATLDGEPVAVPSTLRTDDLAAGEHALTVTATDTLGNTSIRTVRFTVVPEDPDAVTLVAPSDGSEGQSASPELRVSATDPAGDPLTVTFYEAGVTRAAAALGAWQGSAPTEPPADLAGAEGAALTGAELATATREDGEELETRSTDAYPYQRYDLRVPETDADATALEVQWRGHSLANRQVTVYAWDFLAGEWASLATGRDPEGADMALTGTLDPAAHARDGVAHLLVQDLLPDPASYDFSFAWITDTQYYSEGFPEVYDAMNTWIVDQAEEREIAYTLHTGDLVEHWDRDLEWERASASMAILDEAGMPYGVTAGNHDNASGRNHTNYWRYFGEDRFTDRPYYGGSLQNNENHYDLIDAGGAEFIILYMGFSIGQPEYDWANEVLARYPERNAIFATHEYLGVDGSYSGQGAEIFEEVIVPNENVFLVLAGHNHGVAYNVKRVGERAVVEMMANYQFAEDEQGRRATGYLRMLQFDVAAGTMDVNTYSPFLDDENYFEDEKEEFTVDVDLRPAERLVATDALWLQARTDRVIGAPVDVPSGGEAAVTWDGLAPDRTHHWYAEATDAFGGSLRSPVWGFQTAAAEGGCTGTADGGTVVLRDVDTGLVDRVVRDGCTIDDLIEDEQPWPGRGRFVRHVGEVSRDLLRDGLLSGRERGLLMRAAARAGEPARPSPRG